MPLELWLAFVAASAVLLVLPGPTILTVISYSATHGRRASLALVLGVALGDSTALVLSLFGLGALLAASAFWFNIVKWVGGLYLLAMGLKMLRAAAAGPAVPAGTAASAASTASASPTFAEQTSRWRLFVNTYLVTALNPKGIVFFVAFLPQFLSAAEPIARQLWVLGSSFVVLATLNAALYARFASAAARWLRSDRAQRRFHVVGGSLLCAAGVWALLAERPAR